MSNISSSQFSVKTTHKILETAGAVPSSRPSKQPKKPDRKERTHTLPRSGTTSTTQGTAQKPQIISSGARSNAAARSVARAAANPTTGLSIRSAGGSASADYM
jgi:hypothetical protein